MSGSSRAKIYGAVTVGERGQVVIPSDIRKSFKVKAGDKLIVFAKVGGPISFFPAEEFSEFINEASQAMAKYKG